MAILTKRLSLFQLAVIAAVVALPLVAFGQTSLPTTGSDGVGFNGAGPGTVVNYFAAGTNNWIAAIAPVAKALFWALAIIDFTWTCITLVIQHSELQGWMAGFIRKILTIGFFAVLLQNGAAWVSAIVNFFISLGGTAGGVDVSSLSASDIMGAGVQLAGHMLKAAAGAAASGGATNPIGLLVNGIGALAPALILALGAFLIVIAYVIIALHFVMAMVEAYVVVGAGYIFLGFGGSRWTVPYTEKYMGMVVSAGVRIMVLELLIGLGQTLYTQWVATADAIANTPDILDGGTFSSGWTGVQSEFGLVASILIYALLCWTIPQIAANVASGGLSMSGGDVLASGAAAGTAAFAGANYASSSSASNAGLQSDVQQVAAAAAIKGAEIGVTAAMAAATGGTGAVAGTAEMAASGSGGMSMAGEVAGRGIVVPAPESLDGIGGSSAGEESVPSSLDPSAVYEGRDGSSSGASGGNSSDASASPTEGVPSGEAASGAMSSSEMGQVLGGMGKGISDSFAASTFEKLEAGKPLMKGGLEDAISSAYASGEVNSASDVKNVMDSYFAAEDAEKSVQADGDRDSQGAQARVDSADSKESSASNAAAGEGNSRQQFEAAVKETGNQARLEALAQGMSPQDAIRVEKEARSEAAKKGMSLLGRASGVANDLERAFNKLPDDGGRINGTTPNMGHDNGE